MIPIFDSLTHPTLTGKWINSNINATFELLVQDLSSNNITKACAVGLYGVEDYDHQSFITECSKYETLIPIAGTTPKIENIEDEIQQISRFGYRGVKLHPRFGNFNFTDNKDLIIQVLKACNDNNLVVFLCTYLSCEVDSFPVKDPYWELADVFRNAPQTKVVLLHGGTTRLLEYADLARFNPNLLLDLSYTMIKYKGSSLDLDMKYLFQTFDQKLCIGSDHPEFSAAQLRARAEELSEGISDEKKENIFYKNLTNFLNNLWVNQLIYL